MRRTIFYQVQYSNYNKNGEYILGCDSNWNIMRGRLLNLAKYDDFNFIVTVPDNSQVYDPKTIALLCDEMHKETGSRFIPMCFFLENHAFKTRFDFPWSHLVDTLDLYAYEEHSDTGDTKISELLMNCEVAIINDPMLLDNWKAFFYCEVENKHIKFISNCHFYDYPSFPKVPKEISYWPRQAAAAVSADLNVFQCDSALQLFKKELNADNAFHGVSQWISDRCRVWDDGYSTEEINSTFKIDSEINYFFDANPTKVFFFFPNRISLYKDYTNAGKLIDAIIELAKTRDDFMVIFGNPSQKYIPKEIEKDAPKHIKVFSGPLTRNRYKTVLSRAHAVVSLYVDDPYGGCAFRECLDKGLLPIAPNINEYEDMFDDLKWLYKCKIDFSDLYQQMQDFIRLQLHEPEEAASFRVAFKKMIIGRSSYESTSASMFKDIMELIK